MGEIKPPLEKRSIKPVTLKVTVVATRINENGTFSQFEVVSAEGPNDTFKVSCPPQGGGSIYLKVASLEGLKVIQNVVGSATKPKAKVF
jgi:hypothetical protein